MNCTLQSRLTADTRRVSLCDNSSACSLLAEVKAWRNQHSSMTFISSFSLCTLCQSYLDCLPGTSIQNINPIIKEHVFISSSSLSVIMIILILNGMADSIIHAGTYNDPTLNTFVSVLWIMAVTASHSASILVLLLNVTRHRNYMGNVLSTISRVDSKLLHTNCKHSVYMQQRSLIVRQLMIQFILYGSMSAFSVISFYDGTWTCLVFLVSQALTNAINRLEILKCVNIVLIVKRRYQYIRQLLSEAACTDEECASRHPLSQWQIILVCKTQRAKVQGP
jgi:hypothetical protein